jgi:hypothetical protein
MFTLTNDNIDEWVESLEDKINSYVADNCPETVEATITVYEPRTPHFSSYDDWKLASPDDYYNEKEVDVDVDIDVDEVTEYVLENFHEDIALGTYDEKDLDARVEAACKKCIDAKVEFIKEEYESGKREYNYEPDDYEPDYD